MFRIILEEESTFFFIQSLVYPLKIINDRFIDFAKERHIEARMTSQVMYFEWYLNHKFGKYFADKNDRIYIQDSQIIGIDLYRESSKYGKPFVIWKDMKESELTDDPLEKPREFYFIMEEKAINKGKFHGVCSPNTGESHKKEFVYMLSSVVNTYKIAGKHI